MSPTTTNPLAGLDNLVEILRWRAQHQPHRTAYIFLADGEREEGRLTWRQLDLKARSIAALLGELGGGGERVLLLYPAGLDYVAAFYGCLYAGAVAVPAYPPRPNRPMPRIRSIVADAEARVALTTAAVFSTMERRIADLPDLKALSWRSTDGDGGEHAGDWHSPKIGPDTLAFLQYTSGSTATPKGVMVSHGNLMHNEDLIRQACGHGPDTPCVSWLPLYHDLGLIGNMLQSLYVGTPCTLMSPVAFLQRPARWLRAISKYGAHTSGGPNFAYELCMAKISPEERRGLDLSSWRVAFNGAEPVRRATLERFARELAPCGFAPEALFPCYGLAETTLIVSGSARDKPPVSRLVDGEALGADRVAAAEPEARGARWLVSSGRILGGMDVAIVAPETRNRLPEGRVGEIWVAGGSVTRGYWNRPEVTAETFGAFTTEGDGPYLRTGDLGFLDGGELYITGRLKDLIIIRGTNHYPQDIELTVETAHPALRPGCGAAFSLEHGGEEHLVVVQEIERTARNTDPEEIAAAVRKALFEEHELRLSALCLIKPGTIPKTTSGKIQRRKTKELYRAGELDILGQWREGESEGLSTPAVTGEVGSPPSRPVALGEGGEEVLGWLTSRVASVVGLAAQQVDPRVSLLDYGLDSLRAIELMHGVQQVAGVTLDLERLFDGPSVADLAGEITAALARGDVHHFPSEIPAAEGDHPLSHGQRALWFLHRLDPESSAYNMASAVRVRSNLDVRALAQAMEALIERHPALRTTFHAEHGEPRQRVHPTGELDFHHEEASTLSLDELRRQLVAESRRPFDLETGPLLRVRVWTRVAADHILMLTAHHIISDFWSMAVLIRELAVLYTAKLTGERTVLPDPVANYPEFIRWQRKMLEGPEGDRLAEYWGEVLDGELPVLELPTDRPRPPVQTTRGAVRRFRLGPTLTRRLRERAQERKATLFTALLAAWQVLLARYSGQRDLLVGSPAAGRRHARLAGLVGYFVNPLVLRGNLSDDPVFSDFVDRLREVVVGAFEHQDYPFPLLVSDLQPERDASRSPLFQVMFALQAAPTRADEALIPFAMNEAGSTVQVGGLRLEHLELSEGLAQFDLTLSMGEVGQGTHRELVGELDYNADLFDDTTIERMAANFRVLLEAVAADPGRRVGAIPAIAEGERTQVLLGWNATRADYPRDAMVQDMVEVQAIRVPEAVAVVCGDEVLSHGELDRRANRMAWALREAGVGAEELVALAAERSVDLIAGSLGILRAGAAYMPLDLGTPAERLAYMLEDAGIRRVVVSAVASSENGAEPPPWLAGRQAFPLSLCRDRRLAVETPISRTRPESAACLIYTSGSTGEPKGVLLEHRGLVNLITSFRKSYNAGPGDAILPMTSVAFSSFVGEIWPLLAVGGRVVLPSQEELLDPHRTIDLIAHQGISILSAVPSVIASLNAMADSLPRLRLILSGGDALAAGDIDHLLGTATVVNGYGLTETTICSTIYPLSREDFLTNLAIPIGKPVINHRLYVLTPGLEMAPIGAVGELCVAGEGLARGFLARPRDTAERFVPDPFFPGERMFRTGDLASFRTDGHLVFRGRRDFQVKIRGYRIELGEIESVLGRHPDIQEAVVTVRAADGALATGSRAEGSAAGVRRLVAYVVFCGEARPTSAELAEWAREFLPQYMVPGTYVPMEALPLTRNGKVDVRALPVPAAPTPAEVVLPSEGPEGTIAEVWQEVLGLPQVGVQDNFFDLGGHSLLLARVHARLREELGEMAAELSLVDLFRFPTIASLARYLSPPALGEEALAPRSAPRPAAATAAAAPPVREIAIIAVSGRFPGAKTPEELWANITAGVESITRFTDEEVLASGIDPELVADPNYIKAKGILGGVDLFDAGFFGMSPRGAELTDPQHRAFLEVAWEALERAGHDPDRHPGAIGVFAGQSMNTYWLNNLYYHIDLVASVDSLAAAIGNDKDSLTTEVSYRLNLTGPSVLVQSSSSTSLTAIHYACRSLQAGECEMAIAGGVSIHVPEVSGYLYHEGGTTDPEGHCRTFSADAKGFVSGHGAGAVVLKPLDAALADGDPIVAVIKGSACNNDGSLKVSYMAPSVDGHARVVAAAQEAAGVLPETVTLIEAHGTGTLLGDPIEVAALTQAFRRGTDARNFCALGSVKTNIGHLDTAAGVAGLIKASLCLAHQQIPPILHFTAPNPKIDFAASPFFVRTELSDWEVPEGMPRRAGVSSLGMGGTNTHVVLEEAPPREPSGPSRPWQLLRLSARTASALEAATANLAAHLRAHPELPLADVALTLDVGRKRFEHRRVVVAVTGEEAAELLATMDPERVASGSGGDGSSTVVFLFSGQGSQYVGMGRELYEHEPRFRSEVDRCCDLLLPHLGLDLRTVLYPEPGGEEEAAALLAGTDLTQPSLFVVEYALARLWMAWGVIPRAMIGHSIGEYVAACLAGVFSLPDALTLVAERGRLMGSLPPGAMLAVPLPEEEVRRRFGDLNLAVAAVNRPGMTVVSGPADAVEAFRTALAGEGIEGRPLHTSHAFHSAMMDPILPAFTRAVTRVERKAPKIPYLSNVTGTWIRPEEATDPAYYARHLRGTVRFAAGLDEVLRGSDRAVLEVGPGNALATNVRQHPALAERRSEGKAPLVLSSLPHARERHSAQAFLLTTLGRLWLGGVTVDSEGFWAGERRRRVVLPTYPFERQRYWVEPGSPAGVVKKRIATDPGDWLWAPVWKQSHRTGLSLHQTADLAAAVSGVGPWLVFAGGGEGDAGSGLARRLGALGARVSVALPGDSFRPDGPDTWRLRPGVREDVEALLDTLRRNGGAPRRVVHAWSRLGGDGSTLPGSTLAGSALLGAREGGLETLLALARGLGEGDGQEPVDITVVTVGLRDLTGEEPLAPEQALALGAVRAAPREYSSLGLRTVDLPGPPAVAGDGAGVTGWPEPLLDRLLREAASAGPAAADLEVALRGPHRFTLAYEPVEMPTGNSAPVPLREGGVYVITGGLGGLGLAVAEDLARSFRARLVLVGRTPLPPREEWPALAEARSEGQSPTAGTATAESLIAEKVARLLALEEAGAEVLTLAADVADRGAVEEVRVRARERFGVVHGVIHAAGVPGGNLLALRQRREGDRVLAPKVAGTLHLAEVFAAEELDFLVLFSSVSSILSQLGQADYAAANAYLDAFAHAARRRGLPVVSLGWDAWREVGMAVTTPVPDELRSFREESLRQGLSPEQGLAAFRLALALAPHGLPQLAITRTDFETVRQESLTSRALAELTAAGPAPDRESHARPELGNAYAAPGTETEERIVGIWQEILGVEPVGIHDNFFELGGNSLVGLKVISRIKEAFACEIPVVSLFEGPTVAALGRIVERNLKPEEGEAEPAFEDRRNRGARRRERLRQRKV